MRKGGNKLVNALFEAKLKDTIVKPDKYTELEERSEFIYKKYQHRQWYDPAGCEVVPNNGLPEEDLFGNGGAGSDFAEWGNLTFPSLSLDEVEAESPQRTSQGSGVLSPFGSFTAGSRRNLISTLERMESKSNVLEDITHLDVGPDPTSPEPKPKKLKKKKKKKTESGRSRSTSPRMK